jgi:tetratricopeptide (TPR) repeat protein
MRQRRPRVNWFLVLILLALIALVTYTNRYILPAVTLPGVPTLTPTRDPESYVTEADALFADGKLLQSIDTYMEAIRITPDNPSLYLSVARVQIFAGRLEEALTNTENALLLNPNNSIAHALRGWALTQLGRYDEAEASIKEALRLDPNNGIAHAYYAFLLGRMDLEETGPYVDPIQLAIEESRVAAALAPASLEARWARAFILYITGNFEESIQEYKAAININANISEIHLELGITYAALGVVADDAAQTDSAIQEYTLANTLNPSDFRPDLYSSRALLRTGQPAKAVQYAESAVRDDPTSGYLRGNLGYMLYKNFEWPASAEQFDLAVKGGTADDGRMIQPITLQDADTWVVQYYYAYVVLLAQLNRCDEVLPLAQALLGGFPNNEFAVYNANLAQEICAENLANPALRPTATPETTPTP